MKQNYIFLALVILIGFVSCTNDFTDINTDPNGTTKDEASAKYFITNPQYNLYAQGRYAYWRAQLIHTDRYAGYFCFGFSNCWWSDDLAYSYSSGYTDASWDWLDEHLSGLDTYIKLTEEGGDFENEQMYATGLIMKGLYYQMFTDIFGEIPYNQAANPNIILPEFDEQIDIYKGIIDDLDMAMSIIGNETVSGVGINNLSDNDLYCQGDMQKWKKLANTLKLRIAIRAYGAPGENFSRTAVSEAILANLFLETEADNVLLEKDVEIDQQSSGAYGDIWHNFGGFGSKWTVGEQLINYLQDFNDPRLAFYAKPALGGIFGFKQPELASDPEPHDYFFERVRHIRDKIAYVVGNTDFYQEFTDSVAFSLPENTLFIGQPTRFSAGIKTYAKWEFYSQPAETIIAPKGKGAEKPFNELIITTGECYLLRAQAAVLGLSGENAQAMYQEGIRFEMSLWGVSDGDIQNFLNNSSMGQLNGTIDQQLEKIAIQRWISKYTDGFEGWAIVRKSGYPTELAKGVSNNKLYYIGGNIGNKYPQRMRYGNRTYTTNGTNTNAANTRQGADLQNTKLWFVK